MANIKTISTVDVPQAWEVVYEVDFTAEDSGGNLNSGASIPLQGKTWTCRNGSNSVYCTSLAINPGNGLQIFINTGDTDSNLYPAQNTAPRLEILASLLVSGLDSDDTVAFQVLQESTGLDDDWQYYGIHMSDGSGLSSAQWVENITVHVSGWAPAGVGSMLRNPWVGVPDIGSYTQADPVEFGMRALHWSVGSCGFIGSANAASEFVDPSSSTDFEGIARVGTDFVTPGTTPTNLPISLANGVIGLHAAYDDSGGATVSNPYTATYTKFRVLKRTK